MKTDLIESIKTAQQKINEAQERLGECFQQELVDKLKENPDIKNIEISITDGDCWIFHYNQMNLRITGERGKIKEFDFFTNNGEKRATIEAFHELFRSFDVGNFYEYVFGDYSEFVEFTLVDGELRIA
jgi:phosphoribulokinase